MTAKDGDTGGTQDKFGSGTPGDQGTYSGVGAQPGGGGAGLGEQVESGDGSAQDIAEAGGNPQHRNSSGPDSAQVTESASQAYEQTERPGSVLHPGSGDRNTQGDGEELDR